MSATIRPDSISNDNGDDEAFAALTKTLILHCRVDGDGRLQAGNYAVSEMAPAIVGTQQRLHTVPPSSDFLSLSGGGRGGRVVAQITNYIECTEPRPQESFAIPVKPASRPCG